MENQATSIDPRIARSKALLQDALLSLRNDKPFGKISVQDITRRAGVNRSTFYAHYTDKSDLLADCIREGFRERLHQSMPEAGQCGDDYLVGLMQTTRDFLTPFKRGCDPQDRQFDPVIKSEVQQQLFAYIQDWLTGRDDVPNPEATALVVSWAIFGAASQWQQMNTDPDQLAQDVYGLIARLLP